MIKVNEELQENQKKLLRADAIPSSSEPSQAPPFVDQPMPHQEPPTRHSGGTTSSLFFSPFDHIEDNVQLGWGGELRKEVFCC